MNANLVKEFRNIPILSDLSEDELGWLADHAEVATAEAGEIVIRENEPADSMVIYLEGETDGRRESLGPDSPVYTARAGQITGMLPFSRLTNYTITARAVTHLRVARIAKTLFPEMLNRIPALGPTAGRDPLRSRARGDQAGPGARKAGLAGKAFRRARA